MNSKIIKIVLATLLLFCIFKMPYGFYQFVRFEAMVGFPYLGYLSLERNSKNVLFLYIVLALLFQPFLKLALGRTIWNIVDVTIAIALLLSLSTEAKSDK